MLAVAEGQPRSEPSKQGAKQRGRQSRVFRWLMTSVMPMLQRTKPEMM